MEFQTNRRAFLKTTLSGLAGLTLGIGLNVSCKPAKTLTSRFVTIWLNISPENIITVMVVRNEMGQGISTALPMLVAEEFEADLEKDQI